MKSWFGSSYASLEPWFGSGYASVKSQVSSVLEKCCITLHVLDISRNGMLLQLLVSCHLLCMEFNFLSLHMVICSCWFHLEIDVLFWHKVNGVLVVKLRSSVPHVVVKDDSLHPCVIILQSSCLFGRQSYCLKSRKPFVQTPLGFCWFCLRDILETLKLKLCFSSHICV